MLTIAKSDFYCYYLGNKKIGCFFSCCKKGNHYLPPMFLNENAAEPKKENVLSYYQNILGMDITQFNLEAAEYALNISLASICIVYDSLKSGNIVEYSKDNANEGRESNREELIWQTQDIHHYHKYSMNKKSFREDKNNQVTNFASSLLDKTNTNYRNTVDIEVKSFYPNDINKILENHNVDLNLVKASLLSHVSKFSCLISKNSKESYFKTLKTFSLKTNDRKLSIEIFDDIFNEDSTNADIEMYLDHLIMKNSTFLQVVIGIFKIKINKYSPFFIIITKNSILENVPKDVFNYWQLMRYPEPNQIEIISTSKDRTSVCVTEERLFNGLRIQILNYETFLTILSDDLELLRKLRSNCFSLLIMYYEFEANRKSLASDMGISKDNQSGSVCRMSDIKQILYQEDLSSLTDLHIDFNLSKCRREGNGFDATVNRFKCMLFFSFEGVFSFRGVSYKSVNYKQFYDSFIENFDEMKMGDNNEMNDEQKWS